MTYLDHNASTPVRPEVTQALAALLASTGANPSSLHGDGQAVRAVVEHARREVAALVHARPEDVAFTSGGTEADHLALVGGAWALRERGRRVAISTVEHHAVHGAAEWLVELGFTVEHLPCDRSGIVDPARIDALPADTTLVALMLANNETGVIQPVADATARAHARGMRVHCDAVQAVGKIPVDLSALDVDYLALSAHKFGGMKGAGALITRRDAPLAPLFRGSAQERGRRAGTENVPGIRALGFASALATRELAEQSTRWRELRRRFETGLRERVPDAVVHGESAPRLPNTVNFSVPGARSDNLLMALDAHGVAVSAGAACASGAVEPSPVLTAMGVPRELAVCALRVSFGHPTTEGDIDAALAALAEVVPRVRAVTAGSPA
ncbi:MAG: cysteine desulfurase [Candidatus Eisenbacteria bacterium]|uniref:cysteine desulfurase n=1 Tax=Eiseniibacteriota bacterium TaxID=2212470 RepID=A0A849SIQ3_UNCEI|nr:cysteine desulfurase [Candidatus Eisenbacteria bacterium]